MGDYMYRTVSIADLAVAEGNMNEYMRLSTLMNPNLDFLWAGYTCSVPKTNGRICRSCNTDGTLGITCTRVTSHVVIWLRRASPIIRIYNAQNGAHTASLEDTRSNIVNIRQSVNLYDLRHYYLISLSESNELLIWDSQNSFQCIQRVAPGESLASHSVFRFQLTPNYLLTLARSPRAKRVRLHLWRFCPPTDTSRSKSMTIDQQRPTRNTVATPTPGTRRRRLSAPAGIDGSVPIGRRSGDLQLPIGAVSPTSSICLGTPSHVDPQSRHTSDFLRDYRVSSLPPSVYFSDLIYDGPQEISSTTDVTKEINVPPHDDDGALLALWHDPVFDPDHVGLSDVVDWELMHLDPHTNTIDEQGGYNTFSPLGSALIAAQTSSHSPRYWPFLRSGSATADPPSDTPILRPSLSNDNIGGGDPNRRNDYETYLGRSTMRLPNRANAWTLLEWKSFSVTPKGSLWIEDFAHCDD
eukprot:GHVO01050262.1.p1 GENE.GHVO01050262.1~~GHVO01050262.1.p1  ORF type:complete len:467 (+),score=49.20 GHVO01050262.1:1-1401(+)